MRIIKVSQALCYLQGKGVNKCNYVIFLGWIEKKSCNWQKFIYNSDGWHNEAFTSESCNATCFVKLMTECIN